MNTIVIILMASLLFLCNSHNSFKQQKQKDYTIYVSPFKPLIFSDDHTSEGFLVTLKDNRVLLIFRFDLGIEGDHVGTQSYLASIPYDPKTDTWGNIETVYNDIRYDDRNIHGGITKEGRIVIFFRKYDGQNTEGRYIIYSDDNGKTWTEPSPNKIMSDPETLAMRGNMSTGRMFYNPDIGKYMMLGILFKVDKDQNYISRRRYTACSKDGAVWEEFSIFNDKSDYKINEIAGAWCGNNRIIALHRDDDRKYGHPFLQVESYDNGKTWTKPVQTNIPPGKHWGAAPQIIYDRKRDLLIVLGSDRYSRPDEQNSLFIYTARPFEVFGKPEGWKLQHELIRPLARLEFTGKRPLNGVFYGYPTIAPVNEDEYLVVFTERSLMDGSEQADLYYFRMIIK